VRPFVVVILHPVAHSFAGLLEAVELRPDQELLPDRFPEPFDLAQRHRVVRLAAEVVDPVFGQFLFKAGLAPPVRVLPPVVGKHLFGQPVLCDSRAVDLQHVLGALAAEQVQPNHVTRLIVNEADQVGVLAAKPEGEDVALPHLVGRAALEEPRLGRVLRHPLARPGHEPVLVQRAAHRLVTARQKQHTPQQLGNPLHAVVRMLLFQRGDLQLDRRRHFGRAASGSADPRLEPGLAVLPVATNPRAKRALADPGFAGHQFQGIAFLQPQLDRFQPQFDRIGLAAAPRCPPRGAGLLPLGF